MQIVIDIPDEMYQGIKETFKVISGSRRSERFDYILFNAVNTGTPLPKSHGDLIDKSELTTVTEIEPDGSECTYVPYSEIENANVVVEADKEG